MSEKLVGRTRTKLIKALFCFFDVPIDFVEHVFGNLYARYILTRRDRELCAKAAVIGIMILNRPELVRFAATFFLIQAVIFLALITAVVKQRIPKKKF
jgi:hypothetical protein